MDNFSSQLGKNIVVSINTDTDYWSTNTDLSYATAQEDLSIIELMSHIWHGKQMCGQSMHLSHELKLWGQIRREMVDFREEARNEVDKLNSVKWVLYF